MPRMKLLPFHGYSFFKGVIHALTPLPFRESYMPTLPSIAIDFSGSHLCLGRNGLPSMAIVFFQAVIHAYDEMNPLQSCRG